jgi:hypothetical protein
MYALIIAQGSELTVFKYLPGSPFDPNGQFYIGGEIQIYESGQSYSGYGTYIGGWNNGEYTVNLCEGYTDADRRTIHRLLLW